MRESIKKGKREIDKKTDRNTERHRQRDYTKK